MENLKISLVLAASQKEVVLNRLSQKKKRESDLALELISHLIRVLNQKL